MIFIESSDNNIILRGDIDKIKSSRRTMMYLRNNFTYEMGEDYIVITNVSSINDSLDDIKIIARYVGSEVSYGANVSEEIRNYQRNEELFSRFSLKAKEIRNEHPDPTEFREFEEVLQEELPTRTLYPLQLLSAYHMAFAQNSCNFSVPGAGKTSIVYGAYAYLHSLPIDDPKRIDNIFIIGPLSSFGPWEIEFNECFGRAPSLTRLTGKMSRTEKELYLSKLSVSEITLTSYQSVPTLVDEMINFLKNHKRTMLVLDEAHKIKNYSGAITAQSVLRLAPYANSRIILTGTPAPQGYADLNNLYKFIWPERNIIGFSISQLLNMNNVPNDSRIDTLLDRISPFFIRIKKSDLGIPEAQHRVIPVEMSSSQRDIYDVIEKHFMEGMSGGDRVTLPEEVARARMMRLIQVATNPALLRNSLSEYYDENGNVSQESDADKDFLLSVQKYWKDELPQKFIVATSIAREIISNGGKVIIWTSFIQNVITLEKILESNGIKVKTLYGATPVAGNDESEEGLETRESIVKEFNQPVSSFNVIIANPFAVAESISLHKQCHNAIYLDRNFNAANFIQSKDRIHRYGLKPDVVTQYYYLVSTLSIDETVNRRLEEKESRLIRIMESMPIPLFENVNEDEGFEDIKAVIKDYVSRIKSI